MTRGLISSLAEMSSSFIRMNESSQAFSELQLDQLRVGDVVMAFRAGNIQLGRTTLWHETVFIFMGCSDPYDFESQGSRTVSSGIFVVELDVIVPARGERKLIELPADTIFRVLI